MVNKNDKKSGSIAYNRLDMQISQVFHLAIELYNSLDYLLVLDYEDDITLYENENSDGFVSFYQMKTTENMITLNTALTEGWIDKLYLHLEKPDVFVRELGLITNCPWKLEKQTISAEKTPFTEFNMDSIVKIKSDVAKKLQIPVEEVDLTKMCHMRTTLSIDRHRDIVQSEAMNFLYKQFSQIKVETIKTIVATVFELLNRQQGYERLSENASFAEIKSKKGFAKSTFEQIIRYAIRINIPEFSEVKRLGKIPDSEENRAGLAYSYILGDFHQNTDAFSRTFDELEKIIDNNPSFMSDSPWMFACLCKKAFQDKIPELSFLYRDYLYIEMLSLCILLSKGSGKI